MRLGSKRYVFTRKTDRTRITRAIIFILLPLSLLSLFLYTVSVIRPAFASLAENRAKQIALRTINETVVELFSNEQTDYHDIVEFERNNDNSINAVKSNLANISKLKSELNLEILKKIDKKDSSELSVPLGSLMGNDLFAGLGPSISFKIKPYGSAVTDISTDFTDAGINQTKLDVTVKVKADFSVLMPTMRKKSSVETTVPIISTVIVGDVPENYTNIEREGLAYEDDVLEVVR